VFLCDFVLPTVPRRPQARGQAGHRLELYHEAALREVGLVGPALGLCHRHPQGRRGQPAALDQNFAKATEPDKVWGVDITCIATREGFLYLAGVMDLCSRRIVGWSMSDSLTTSIVEHALHAALLSRKPAFGLLHHSDRGVQYTSAKYRALLAEHGITPSMSRTGNCDDNAMVESFWGKLKCEMVHHEDFATRQQARAAVFEYIEVLYNRKRLHASLDYQSPEQFEAGRVG
jgi:putative transposase